ncbi:MAG: hypothetical protein ABSA11_13295 [Candidatus Bathyarchaeia archaeon]
MIFKLEKRAVTMQSDATNTIDAVGFIKRKEPNPRAGISTNLGLVVTIQKMIIDERIPNSNVRFALILNSAGSQNL